MTVGTAHAGSGDPRPLVWVLVPYAIDGDRLDGDTFETPETKTELALAFDTLRLPWVWQPVVLGSLDHIVTQLTSSSRTRPVLVFNLCDGLDWDGNPGLSVVQALERAGLPFTGADSRFYEISTYKLRMKERFRDHGVETAPWEVVDDGPVAGVCDRLGVPLLIKPEVSFASTGITLRSKVHTDDEVAARRDALRHGPHAVTFAHGAIFAERYLAGDEYTVLVGGRDDGPLGVWTLPPAQRCFAPSIPVEERFLTYDRYWGTFLEETPPAAGEAFYHYELVDAALGQELVTLAEAAYRAVHGSGYARVDIRRDTRNGRLSVLEVNANCGLSGDAQTSTGSILTLMGWSFPGLLGRIAGETLLRWDLAEAAAATGLDLLPPRAP